MSRAAARQVRLLTADECRFVLRLGRLLERRGATLRIEPYGARLDLFADVPFAVLARSAAVVVTSEAWAESASGAVVSAEDLAQRLMPGARIRERRTGRRPRWGVWLASSGTRIGQVDAYSYEEAMGRAVVLATQTLPPSASDRLMVERLSTKKPKPALH